MVLNSKLSRKLANVKEQLRKGTTRSANPRPLLREEFQTLEAQRDKLQAEMVEATRKRVVARVNAHTTTEAQQTREEVRAEGRWTREDTAAQLEPLTSLVAGADDENRAERIKARCNQVSLLQAANREDRNAARKEREEAKRTRAIASRSDRAASARRREKRPRHMSGQGSDPTQEEGQEAA
jgi:hypothetical protein